MNKTSNTVSPTTTIQAYHNLSPWLNHMQSCVIKATTWNEGVQKLLDNEDGQKFEQEFELYSSTDILRTSNGLCTGNDVEDKKNANYSLFSMCIKKGSNLFSLYNQSFYIPFQISLTFC